MVAQFDHDYFRRLRGAELIGLIAEAKENPANAREGVAARDALDELRRRYQKYVNRLARGARSRLLCSVCAEDIVEDVFCTLWERARYFSHIPVKSEKDEHHRICVWLGPPVCHNVIRRLNDKELFVCIARRDESEYARAVAEKAFAELDRRHRAKLRGRCSRFTWGLYSEMEVEELVQDTLNRAWQKAHTYDDKGISDRKALFWRTVGWLNEMARNLFIDGLRRRKDVETLPCEDEETLDSANWLRTWRQFLACGSQAGDTPDGDARAEELEERAVEFTKEALLTVLTDIQRVVYQTDMQDYPDEDAKHAAFTALEASYKITPISRRQHLCRANKKIQKHLQARMKEYLRGLGPQAPPDAE